MRTRRLLAGVLLAAACVAASSAEAQPEGPPPSPARLLFWLVAPLGLLFVARPALHRLTDWLSERGGDDLPGDVDARRMAQERALAPYRRRAQIELTQGQIDAETWTQALQQAAGDELRARDRYVHLRAYWLRKAQGERREATAVRPRH